MDYLVEYYSLILYNPALKSIFIVLTSIISAKVVDIIFTIVFKKIVDKTDTELDNKIIYLLHRPIFYSVLFVGIIIAVKTASLPEYIDFALIGVFKTLTILIWFFLLELKYWLFQLIGQQQESLTVYFKKTHFPFLIT